MNLWCLFWCDDDIINNNNNGSNGIIDVVHVDKLEVEYKKKIWNVINFFFINLSYVDFFITSLLLSQR
jgi:hypothetical protein